MSALDPRRELTITRTFLVGRALVWRAWTDPEMLARWIHPHGVIVKETSVSVDPRVGGLFRFTMVDAEGTEYPTEGTYLELREPELLRSTWGGPSAPVAELEVSLHARSAQETEMTFRLRGHHDDTHRTDSVWTGWREAVEELTAELEAAEHG